VGWGGWGGWILKRQIHPLRNQFSGNPRGTRMTVVGYEVRVRSQTNGFGRRWKTRHGMKVSHNSKIGSSITPCSGGSDRPILLRPMILLDTYSSVSRFAWLTTKTKSSWHPTGPSQRTFQPCGYTVRPSTVWGLWCDMGPRNTEEWSSGQAPHTRLEFEFTTRWTALRIGPSRWLDFDPLHTETESNLVFV
jgi:hypothetical protein